jgi:hypothetical protein
MKKIPVLFRAFVSMALLSRCVFAKLSVSFACLVVIVAIANNGYGQESPLKVVELLSNLSRVVNQIDSRNEGNKVIHEKSVQINTEISTLSKLFSTSKDISVSKSYIETLNAFVDYFEVPENTRVSTKLVAVLQDLSADIAAKVAFAKSSRGRRGSDVSITIRTFRNNREESGFVIWYVPKAWLDTESHYLRFDRLSSPSIMNLPPGNYFIWAENKDLRSIKQPLALGIDRRSLRQVDILVP